MTDNHHAFVVIGGGIAGVSCIEALGYATEAEDDRNIRCTLVSASPLIKSTINIRKYGYTLEAMDVTEKESDWLSERFKNVEVIHKKVSSINTQDQMVKFSDGQSISYTKLCLCTGGIPRLTFSDPRVLYIRDTESVQQFSERLRGARRVVIVGNGGIATELVYEIKNCDVVWAIKQKSICAAFFDESAASFFLPNIKPSNQTTDERPSKRLKYTLDAGDSGRDTSVKGVALGPDWANNFELAGQFVEGSQQQVHIEYNVEVEDTSTLDNDKSTGSPSDFPLVVKLTNGKTFETDLLVCATGVQPNLAFDIEYGAATDKKLSVTDEGIIVDTEMRSNLPAVYAAGDVCDASAWQHSSLWYQMKLWTQAKHMGSYAARCMFEHTQNQPVLLDFCFEIFSHVTNFFGFKVVLLGLYNAQGLGVDEYKVLLRCTPGMEYIKAVVKDGRVIGAVLIGDTDLEETLENIILNQLDISHIEESLLDPDIDIEDYFD